jgi:dienelactone hydrolase
LASDIGVYRELLDSVLDQQGATLSYLAREWPEVEQWRTEARGKLLELLAFRPKPAALDAKVEKTGVHQGVNVEEVSWEVGYGARCQAWVLKPVGATGKLPAVLALHDHGGFKWFGKEKIAENGQDFPLTVAHRHDAYGGRPWANELAKRGFLVLVHDTFAFGSRKVPVESLSERYQPRFKDLKRDTEAYIKAYNSFAGDHEHVLAKSCFTAGTTWPGIYAYEDRRAVDYLLTRSDVEPERIGCGGLSGGGVGPGIVAGSPPPNKTSKPTKLLKK